MYKLQVKVVFILVRMIANVTHIKDVTASIVSLWKKLHVAQTLIVAAHTCVSTLSVNLWSSYWHSVEITPSVVSGLTTSV